MTPAQTIEIDRMIDRVAELLEAGRLIVTPDCWASYDGCGGWMIERPIALKNGMMWSNQRHYPTAHECAEDVAKLMPPEQLQAAIEAAEARP